MHIKIEDYNRLLIDITEMIKKLDPDEFKFLNVIVIEEKDCVKILRNILDTEAKLLNWFDISENKELIGFSGRDLDDFCSLFFNQAYNQMMSDSYEREMMDSYIEEMEENHRKKICYMEMDLEDSYRRKLNNMRASFDRYLSDMGINDFYY